MPEDDKQEILALLRAQEAATARGDAQGVIAPLADDLVTYDMPPPLEYRGAGQPYADGLAKWFDTWDGPVRVELADPTIIVDHDLAIVFGLSRMQGLKKDSGPLDAWNRRTVALQRREGAWKIIHEHSSFPMEMDGSGRAATDLKPE
jgi:ketosteroid isomerase-like protein